MAMFDQTPVQVFRDADDRDATERDLSAMFGTRVP